ncbi:sigma-54 interaction domain-containing protein [Crassaminicella profunda]|uniref:sigma-54 interaction domain-containing protein n=1 Tax=Crassaminicella profunda TaxID=1286698 RepID=UPI001CA6C147|nr:sigma 54-interacting transcriptional regulator [Crassaminicella profunda]QZY54756.1 sigma 54-interacting transcriptional regulator [Crassaminicella profunda]
MEIKRVGKLLMDHIPGIMILNEEEEIIWMSPMVEQIYHQKNILKCKFYDLFSVTLDIIMGTKKIFKTPYGKKYSMSARKIVDEKKEYIFVFIEDIEDFTNHQIRLYCLEKIIDSINDGIIMSDAEGRIILYNDAQEKLEELSAKNIVGKYLWEAYNYKAIEMSEHQKVYKTGVSIVNKYKAHAYKDGVPKYVSYSTYPIKKDGETIAVYSISKNETMLKSLLSQTIELKRRLRSKIPLKSNDYYDNGTTYTFTNIIGDSEQIKNLIKEAETIALLENNLLIVGETGTGKEVFAQSIHNLGKNKKEPFVAINCAAIPENLLESILFGTVKGSYTGAVDQSGLFEEARGGTLFLDELNSMPITMQTKLLRVFQERKVRRVGGLKTAQIHCRIISAINEDPQKIIREGKLRQDLFYRIATICLYIPPLRERPQDILSMSSFFIEKYNNMLNKNIKAFSSELREIMLSYNWPGNVRELEHILENLMIRVRENEKELRTEHLPKYIQTRIIGENACSKIQKKQNSLTGTLRDIEKRIILESLNKNEWNISKTSRDLGIIRQSLIYRMKKLGIESVHRNEVV